MGGGDDIKEAFDRVDVDGSGTLNYQEFKDAILKALDDEHKLAGIKGKMKKTFREGCELDCDGEASYIKVDGPLIKYGSPENKDDDDSLQSIDINEVSEVADDPDNNQTFKVTS